MSAEQIHNIQVLIIGYERAISTYNKMVKNHMKLADRCSRTPREDDMEQLDKIARCIERVEPYIRDFKVKLPLLEARYTDLLCEEFQIYKIYDINNE